MEEKIEQTIVAELQRQAADTGNRCEVRDGVLEIEGPIDVVALATAVVGSIAGGP
jgi:hypothetical protein